MILTKFRWNHKCQKSEHFENSQEGLNPLSPKPEIRISLISLSPKPEKSRISLRMLSAKHENQRFCEYSKFQTWNSKVWCVGLGPGISGYKTGSSESELSLSWPVLGEGSHPPTVNTSESIVKWEEVVSKQSDQVLKPSQLRKIQVQISLKNYKCWIPKNFERLSNINLVIWSGTLTSSCKLIISKENSTENIERI